MAVILDAGGNHIGPGGVVPVGARGIVCLVKVVRGSDLLRKHLDIWRFAACQSRVDLCKTLMGVKGLTLGGGLSGGFQGLSAQETDWIGPGLGEKDSPFLGMALPRLQESVHVLHEISG